MSGDIPHADSNRALSFATRAIHAGQAPEPTTGAVIVPISLSTTFAQETPGNHKGFEYVRTDNPTRRAFEHCLASLEEAKFGMGFASGMAATAAVSLLLRPGDELVCSKDLYGGTYRYFTKTVYPASNVVAKFIDFKGSDMAPLEAAITDKTKIVWIESPSNPMMTVIDIAAVAAVVKKHPGIILVCDNTFATSRATRPLSLGADIVLHSCTKYVGGHSDSLAGFLGVNSDDLNAKLRFIQNGAGGVMSTFDAFLCTRGLKTLSVRMERHSENAMKIATWLEGRDEVDRVFYTGLESHPQHEVAKRQMDLFGGMVSFHLKGNMDNTDKFVRALRVWILAESLGSVESLINHPATMTHASVPKESRDQLGITSQLLRLNVGIENVSDLIDDLERSLVASQL